MSLTERILFSNSESTPWEPCSEKYTSESKISGLYLSTITQKNFKSDRMTKSDILDNPQNYMMLDIEKRRKELDPTLIESIENVDHDLDKLVLKMGVPQFISAEKSDDQIDVFSFGKEKLFIYLLKIDFVKHIQPHLK